MESESCQSEISSDPNRGIVKYLAKCLIELATHSESVIHKIKNQDIHTEISCDDTAGIDITEHNLKVECIEEGPILKVISSLKNCIVELLTLCSQHNIKINYDITRPNLILYEAFDEPQRILVMNNLTLYAISIVEHIINSINLFKRIKYIDNASHIKSSLCNIYKEIKYIPKRPDIINNMDGSFQELTSKNEFTDAYNYLNEKLFILCKYINKFIRAYQKHSRYYEQTTSDENTDKSDNNSNEKKRKLKEIEQEFIKTENDQVFKIPKPLNTKKNKNGLCENETINNIESNETIERSPSKKNKHKKQDHDKEFHNNDAIIESKNVHDKNKINTSIENKTDSPRKNKKKKLGSENSNNNTVIENDNNEILNDTVKNQIDTLIENTTNSSTKTKKKRKNNEGEYHNNNKTIETDNVEFEILNKKNQTKINTSIENKTNSLRKNKKKKLESENHNDTIKEIDKNEINTLIENTNNSLTKTKNNEVEYHNNKTVETDNVESEILNERNQNKINTSIENKADSRRKNSKKKLESENHNNDTITETENNENLNDTSKNKIDTLVENTTDSSTKTKMKRKNKTDNVESEILNEMDTSIENKIKSKKRKSETINHLNNRDESINLEDSHKQINVSKSFISQEETVLKDNEQNDIIAPYQPELFSDILHAIETGQFVADFIKEYNDHIEFFEENSISEDNSVFANSGDFSDYKQIISENSLTEDEKFLHIQNLLETVHDKSIISDEDIEKLTNLYITIDFEIPPAHLIGVKLSAGPTHAEKEQLEALGVISGHFTKEESNIIRNNWQSFSKTYGFENNPTLFTTLYYNNKSYLSYAERRKFVQFLGQGLPHKALHSIFRHFRKLFQQSIKYGRFSPEEDELILIYMKKVTRGNNRKFVRLAPILNRNRLQIESRYRTLINSENSSRVKWTLELKSKFLNYLLKELNVKTIDDLSEEISNETYLIISKLMNIPPVKLKGHWLIHLYTQLFAKRPLYRLEIKKELIQKLYKMKVKDIIRIDWEKILPDFKGFTKYYLLFHLQSTIHYQVPQNIRTDFRDSIVYLHDNYLPKLKLKKKKIDSRLQYTKDGELKQYNK